MSRGEGAAPAHEITTDEPTDALAERIADHIEARLEGRVLLGLRPDPRPAGGVILFHCRLDGHDRTGIPFRGELRALVEEGLAALKARRAKQASEEGQA